MRRYALVIAALVVCATPLGAQGKGPKKYAVSNDRALIVTKEVLVKQGYEVVRVENSGRDYIVWYRRGNRGRGKGKGPPVKMVIHRTEDRVVFLSVPSAVRSEEHTSELQSRPHLVCRLLLAKTKHTSA